MSGVDRYTDPSVRQWATLYRNLDMLLSFGEITVSRAATIDSETNTLFGMGAQLRASHTTRQYLTSGKTCHEVELNLLDLSSKNSVKVASFMAETNADMTEGTVGYDIRNPAKLMEYLDDIDTLLIGPVNTEWLFGPMLGGVSDPGSEHGLKHTGILKGTRDAGSLVKAAVEIVDNEYAQVDTAREYKVTESEMYARALRTSQSRRDPEAEDEELAIVSDKIEIEYITPDTEFKLRSPIVPYIRNYSFNYLLALQHEQPQSQDVIDKYGQPILQPSRAFKRHEEKSVLPPNTNDRRPNVGTVALVIDKVQDLCIASFKALIDRDGVLAL